MIVGLTGGIGSGKSTVAKFFSEFNTISLYIADDEAKKLMLTNALRKQISNEFGEKAYINNTLNRKHISDIVFKDKNKLQVLNSIVHPAVKNHFNEFIKKNSAKDYILYENAILFENGNDAICDVIICVTIPVKLRIERIINRDHVTEIEVLNRMKNQWIEEKKLLQSNYVIYNFTKEQSEKEVKRIHNILTKFKL
jgi:dephospho-CoA kinase